MKKIQRKYINKGFFSKWIKVPDNGFYYGYSIVPRNLEVRKVSLNINGSI